MTIKVAVVTLGCDKNTVDSECMLGLLQANGYIITNNFKSADIIIINTCGFISAAKEESIYTILEVAKLKKKKPKLKIIAAGCLVQKYHQELAEELPEVDGFIGSNNVPGLLQSIEQVLQGRRNCSVNSTHLNGDTVMPRIISTPRYYSYLKIAEGCDNKCTYCAIPAIRGSYSSRSMASLVEEASFLAENGVQELSLVAQDVTSYGKDLYGEYSLVKLLQELVKIDKLIWIRLLYCYPEFITDELIEYIAQQKKICKYLDIPLQHADEEILRKMGRKQKTEQIRHLLQKIRRTIPDVALRTTFMVGFPGEQERHFLNLLDFMQEQKFDWAGFFQYSAEEGTAAAAFAEQVPSELKEERYQRAMLQQLRITATNNKKWLGRIKTVLVETPQENGSQQFWQARMEQQAPDVDGVVLVRGEKLKAGVFVPVMITGVEDYDLIGEIKNESS